MAALARQPFEHPTNLQVRAHPSYTPFQDPLKITISHLQRTLATNIPSSASGGAGVVDPPIESFGAPAEGPGMPNEKAAREKIIEYHRFTDIYLGGLWNRVEHELGRVEDESSDFE